MVDIDARDDRPVVSMTFGLVWLAWEAMVLVEELVWVFRESLT